MSSVAAPAHASTSGAGAAAAAAMKPPAMKICFNSRCKESKLERPTRKGWRLRSGDFADLCERCYGPLEQGIFCETFHSEEPGWRNCESCGKRLHCGCVVSIHSYMLLDGGGVDCHPCARRTYLMSPGQAWSSSFHVNPQASENKNNTAKTWKPSAGPYPGHWRQAATLWNASSIQSELQQRLAYEFDRPSITEKIFTGGRAHVPTTERKFDDMPERMASTSTNQIMRDRYGNGHSSLDQTYTIYHREGNCGGMHDPNHHAGLNDSMSARAGLIPDSTLKSSPGFNLDTHHNVPANALPSSISKEDLSSLPAGLASHFTPPNGGKELVRSASYNTQEQLASTSLPKHFHPKSVADGETKAPTRNGRSRADMSGRAHSISRYWPKITDQELQQMSGNGNSVATPLFEKVLSASDAGKIGRLVLPKKCAEAYFPTISEPEGLPLKVQDVMGKEWEFQFRFWPNNNSRMYVLEGVTPCIQSMQLQAGDTVTFSRVDPEGKLVMGFRKASISCSSEQGNEGLKSGDGLAVVAEGDVKNMAIGCNDCNHENKVGIELRKPSTISDPASDHVAPQRGRSSVRSPVHTRRGGRTVGPKKKRAKVMKRELLDLSWDEVQERLRPPPSCPPSIVNIDGVDIEVFKEEPVIGSKIQDVIDKDGNRQLWVQCDECFKWRRAPVGAFLPYPWFCSDSTWDPERSSCTAPQEVSTERIMEMADATAEALRKGKAKVENESIENSDGLDTLANLAVLGENEAFTPNSQPTTKHPRHRAGCTCIVCIQPPSGKGPKHKPNCQCNVCQTVKRRFKTLMKRREQRQSEKEAENAKKQQEQQVTQQHPIQPGGKAPPDANGQACETANSSKSPLKIPAMSNEKVDENSEHRKLMSPLKAQIDLNIQPERDEESSSPKSDAAGTLQNLP